jgi:hypothetical protein
LVGQESKKAIATSGPQNASNIALLTQNKLNPVQQVKPIAVEVGWFKLVNGATGEVIAVDNASTEPGRHLVLWNDSTPKSQDQQFQFRLVE